MSDIKYQYDKNGNRIRENDSITGEVKVMTYDEDNRLKTFTKSKNGSITFTQTNQYNGEGKRIRKTETDSTDTNTINYFYQNDAVLYTSDENSNITAFNVMGAEDNVISTVRTDGDDDTCYFYNKDIRESTTNLIDTAGESVVSYEYSDYGETTINDNIDFYNEVCYTGGIYDKNTELYYLNARYYDPDDAVFMTQDTYRGEVNDPSSHNLYAYCANNPVTYTDPSGHFPVAAVVGVAWGAYDGYKYAKKKKLTGWKKAGAIAGGAVLGVVNPFKKAVKPSRIKKIFVREKDSIIRLSINGEVIETTDEHPFFVKDTGWIPAGELRAGDPVKLRSDDYVPVESCDVITLDEPVRVYNFDVADNHTYYVSESKVLVHNDYKNKGKIHANSLKTNKRTDLYVLRDIDTNSVKKIGETTRGKKRYTKKYYKKNNVYMQVIDSGSKRKMHYQQHRLLKKYNRKTGRKPELNKSLW